MQQRRYRVRKVPMFTSLNDLQDCIFAEVPVALEPDQYYRHGQWYCPNPQCSVRQVELHIKNTWAIPAAMHCPACAKPMRFVEWLREVPLTLLEQDGAVHESPEAGSDAGG
jgi:hypothetical protein